jgi:hypothetical protein
MSEPLDDFSGERLHFPHEIFEKLPRWPTLAEAVHAARTLFRIARAQVRGRTLNVHHPDVAPVLAVGKPLPLEIIDKYAFVELMGSLGYRVPRQVLVGGELAAPEKLRRVEDGLGPALVERGLVLKPRYGWGGRGVKVVAGARQLAEGLEGYREDLVVQEFLPGVKHETRFILHRIDGWNLRIAYRKMIPFVTGDGVASVGALVARDRSLPKRAKRAIAKNRRELDLERVPAAGEEVAVVRTCNVTQGAVGGLLPEAELASLDRFALEVIGKIERYAGVRLASVNLDFLTQISEDGQPIYTAIESNTWPVAFRGYLDNVPEAMRKALPWRINLALVRRDYRRRLARTGVRRN